MSCEHDFSEAMRSINALIRSIDRHLKERKPVTDEMLRRWFLTATTIKLDILRNEPAEFARETTPDYIDVEVEQDAKALPPGGEGPENE